MEWGTWHDSGRAGGQRHVPLLLWRTAGFQRWYCAQAAAGNSLLSARVVGTFRVGPAGGSVFYRAARVQVHVAADSGRTWIEIATFREIRAGRLADWATLGMITEVLAQRSRAAAHGGGQHSGAADCSGLATGTGHR